MVLVYLLPMASGGRKENTETGRHAGICLTHFQGLSVSWTADSVFVGFPDPSPSHPEPPAEAQTFNAPSLSPPERCLSSNILHTFAWQTAFCPPGLNSGVTSSRKPSLISPGPGCVLPQHNAFPTYSGNSAVRLLSGIVREGMRSFWMPGKGERQCTVQAYLGSF